MVIGLIGRFMTTRTELRVRTSHYWPCWKRGIPNALKMSVSHRIGMAWREVGKLAREIPSPNNGEVE